MCVRERERETVIGERVPGVFEGTKRAVSQWSESKESCGRERRGIFSIVSNQVIELMMRRKITKYLLFDSTARRSDLFFEGREDVA